MSLIVDDAAAEANSRLTAIRLALLVSRWMENWRKGFGDTDTALIVLAVVAIGGERFTRTGLDPALGDLRTPPPPGTFRDCNISSIAAATGLNRETTRRKVNALVEAGYLVRTAEGEIGINHSGFDREELAELFRMQLDVVLRFANESIRDGVVRRA